MDASRTDNFTNLTVFPYDSNLTGVPWTFVAGFRVFSTTATLLLNFAVFILLIFSKRVVGPLQVYFSNLLIANIVCVAVSAHLDVISWMKKNYWPGWQLCDLHMYMINPCDCMTWAQIIITCNLIWAVTFPLHFHRHHTKKLAVGTCIAMWIVIHSLEVPLLVMDSLWYRLPGETYGCDINFDAQPVLAKTVEILIADMPSFLIVLAYPYLVWRMRGRMRIRKSLRTLTSRRREGTNAASVDRLADSLRTQAKESRRVFFVLTLLAVIAVLSWIPITFVYLAQSFAHYEFPEEFEAFARWMIQTSAAMDPVVIVATSRDLRHEVKGICSTQRKLWRTRSRDISLRALSHTRSSPSDITYNANTSSQTHRSQNNSKFSAAESQNV